MVVLAASPTRGYNKTSRDAEGADIRPVDEFSAHDSGYGFEYGRHAIDAQNTDFALGRSLEYYDLCAVAQITSMKGDSMNTVEPRQARFSIPSLIALVAAICSFVTGAFWGFVLACTAILFGLLGLVLSFLPSIRGGFVSILSLVAGLIGLVLAIFKAAIWLF